MTQEFYILLVLGVSLATLVLTRFFARGVMRDDDFVITKGEATKANAIALLAAFYLMLVALVTRAVSWSFIWLLYPVSLLVVAVWLYACARSYTGVALVELMALFFFGCLNFPKVDDATPALWAILTLTFTAFAALVAIALDALLTYGALARLAERRQS